MTTTPDILTVIQNGVVAVNKLNTIMQGFSGGGSGGGTISGKGTFTLAASSTSTTVVAVSCSTSSQVYWSPQTPDAANDMATTSYVPAVGHFTLLHANNTRVDRTFGFIIVN
jgi:hypothetical protein